MIPFAEWAPDRSIFNTAASPSVTGVLPHADGYSPFYAFTPYSNALPNYPKGGFFARQEGGDVQIFAGTATKLYTLNYSTLNWTDVTRTVGGDYNLGTSQLWRFTQFGDDVIAVQNSDVPQVYDVGSSTDFAALGGSPPTCKYAGVIGDFVLLAGLNGNRRRLRWSALNNDAQWTIRKNSADFQDFPDGGDVVGHATFDRGAVIFQKQCIREMIPAYDSPAIFNFVKTEEERGCEVAGSIVQSGRAVFFLSRDGFYQYGQPSIPIGKDRVDEWFLRNHDPAALHLMQGIDDPDRKIVYWRFKTTAHVNSHQTDKLLIYNYGVNRWAVIDKILTLLAPFGTAGTTLDGLDALGIPLDDLGTSLDSPAWQGGRHVLAAFDADWRLGFFSGAQMEAEISTADIEFNPMRRAFVNGFRPITDSPTMHGTVAVTDVHGGGLTWKDEKQANDNGIVPARADARLHRFKIRIPAATNWNVATGIDVTPRMSGRR